MERTRKIPKDWASGSLSKDIANMVSGIIGGVRHHRNIAWQWFYRQWSRSFITPTQRFSWIPVASACGLCARVFSTY
jgi:hypothetical protein